MQDFTVGLTRELVKIWTTNQPVQLTCYYASGDVFMHVYQEVSYDVYPFRGRLLLPGYIYNVDSGDWRPLPQDMQGRNFKYDDSYFNPHNDAVVTTKLLRLLVTQADVKQVTQYLKALFPEFDITKVTHKYQGGWTVTIMGHEVPMSCVIRMIEYPESLENINEE